MGLEWEVARALLEAHPEEAAVALEAMSAADAVALLARAEPVQAARVLARVSGQPASALLVQLGPARAAGIVAALPLDVAAAYLRRIADASRCPLVEALPESRQKALAAMLHYPERSAGALMDPDVLAIPEDLTVREAVQRVRQSAHHARYNVYVTSRDDVLVGVINLRELLTARPQERIASIAHREVVRLSASASAHTVVEHPGWRLVHTLPVVDDHGVYLGAIRYGTLHQLQAELQPPTSEGRVTAHALGDVFWTGLAGMLDVVAGPRRS